MQRLKDSKKGQIPILRIIVVSLMFLLIWPFLTPTVNTQTNSIIANNNFVGVQLFILQNINLSVFIMFLIFIMAAGLYAGMIR